MMPQYEEFFRKLDELGESEIRIRYANNAFGDWKKGAVEEWFRQKDDQRFRERESHRKTKETIAAIAAIVAAVAATIGAIASIINLSFQ